MSTPLKDRLSCLIKTNRDTLWRVLTEAEFSKEYMFNCAVESTWEKGAPITWQGNFQGYDAFQKGEILAIEKGVHLKFTTFDPNFGLEDIPENYIHVTYDIQEQGDQMELIVTNETFDNNEERMGHIKGGWQQVISGIKTVAERLSAQG